MFGVFREWECNLLSITVGQNYGVDGEQIERRSEVVNDVADDRCKVLRNALRADDHVIKILWVGGGSHVHVHGHPIKVSTYLALQFRDMLLRAGDLEARCLEGL